MPINIYIFIHSSQTQIRKWKMMTIKQVSLTHLATEILQGVTNWSSVALSSPYTSRTPPLGMGLTSKSSTVEEPFVSFSMTTPPWLLLLVGAQHVILEEEPKSFLCEADKLLHEDHPPMPGLHCAQSWHQKRENEMILWIPRWTKELIATKLEEKWNFCCWNNTELAAKKKQQEWSWFWWMWNEKCYNLAWRSMHWRKTWWRNKCVTERELR